MITSSTRRSTMILKCVVIQSSGISFSPSKIDAYALKTFDQKVIWDQCMFKVKDQ